MVRFSTEHHELVSSNASPHSEVFFQFKLGLKWGRPSWLGLEPRFSRLLHQCSFTELYHSYSLCGETFISPREWVVGECTYFPSSSSKKNSPLGRLANRSRQPVLSMNEILCQSISSLLYSSCNDETSQRRVSDGQRVVSGQSAGSQ